MRVLRGLVGVLALLSLACAGGSGAVEIDDAEVACDPMVSAFDDLFTFEAWTLGDVRSVEAEVFLGADLLDRVRLEERSGDSWYGETWADELGVDCDDWTRMAFTFIAEGSDGSTDEAVVNP